MTIDQLKHFTAAARERNLSRAAEQLYISHSAISRSISSLEKELGVRLLDRTSRSVTPTMAGELLYMRATKLLHEFDMIRIDVSELGKAKKGLLRFSSAIPYNENIIIIGPPGVGKSMIATGIGRNAANAGDKVLFANAKELVDQLYEKMQEGLLLTN